MTKKKCDKCGYLFSTRAGNYTRHTNVCDGSYTPYVKGGVRKCKHCKNEFDISEKPKGWMANHTRWCNENPKRQEYLDKIKSRWSTQNPKRQEYLDKLEYARSCITEETRIQISEKIKKAHAEGKYKDVPKKAIETKRQRGNLGHTEETKQLLREKALASPHRRLRKGTVMYKGVLLDSSWELELAKRLDELEIKWVRPDPIPWVDEEGVKHNYFPDFYLEDYDLYLDPKNPQAIKVQKKKLDCLLTQYDNIVIIDSLEKCKQYSPRGDAIESEKPVGKRSDFEKRPKDKYVTPREALDFLEPLLPQVFTYIEPCANDGVLVQHITDIRPQSRCLFMCDVEPEDESVQTLDALTFEFSEADYIITNPPWSRDKKSDYVLHRMIEHFVQQADTWLLFDADWAHTLQSKPYVEQYLDTIVSVGRLKWIPGSTMSGKDNAAWYLFKAEPEEYVRFIGR